MANELDMAITLALVNGLHWPDNGRDRTWLSRTQHPGRISVS